MKLKLKLRKLKSKKKKYKKFKKMKANLKVKLMNRCKLGMRMICKWKKKIKIKKMTNDLFFKKTVL